jgi:hypothetical protein
MDNEASFSNMQRRLMGIINIVLVLNMIRHRIGGLIRLFRAYNTSYNILHGFAHSMLAQDVDKFLCLA